jgi:hypothetical protein
VSITRTKAVAIAALLLMVLTFGSSARAQSQTIQDNITVDVLEQGWWDESGDLAASDMAPVVAKWGDEFAFALSNRALAVEDDPAKNPAALLAQSTLERIVSAGGPQTLLLVTDGHVGGASTQTPFINLMRALEDFDRSAPAASFERAAELAASFGTEVQPVSPVAQSGFFSGVRIFIVLGIITAALALASIRSSRKKTARRVHTAGARSDTKDEVQAMSDLILDLDPRVTIANDAALKERYVDASATFREVLEHADAADTGHEVADLRIEIAKARWKLDVIDAELDGRTPPPEPLTRDASGSAWDSTKGSGTE